MTEHSSNGSRPRRRSSRANRPFADPLETPEEIRAYVHASDPYANMLPGIATIRAAETLSQEVRGRRSRIGMAIISAVMLAALVLPPILALVNHLLHRQP